MVSLIEKIKLDIKNNFNSFRRKPQLFYRMKRHEYLNRYTRSTRLRTIDISVTSMCNFRCNHCYAAELLDEELVPLPALLETIDELLKLGVYHFVLQGGEAILDMDRLMAIVERTKPSQSYINIVSNGYDLSEAVILDLKKQGVDKITISLDSGIQEEHDANRNKKGSFKKALNALEILTEMGMHTSFSTTITHANLYSDGVQQLFELSDRDRYRMDVQVAAPVGKWRGRNDLLITEADADYIVNKVNEGKRNRNHQTLINRDIFPRAGREGCPAVKEFMSITSKGEVLPCTFIQTSFGNIMDRNITEMRNEALKIAWYNRYHPVCLCGEDRTFIQECIEKTNGKQCPVDASTIYRELKNYKQNETGTYTDINNYNPSR